MPNTWFRMYAEFAHDPKVQMLSEAIQRRYVMLLCMRCGNDHVTLHETEVAFQLRISEQEWMETKAILLDKGLITEDNRPAAWDKRQFASDSSAERVARHRAKKKQDGNDGEKQGNEACNVTVTPQIQRQIQSKPTSSFANAQEEESADVAGNADVSKKPNCPAEEIVALYHECLPDNPRCRALNDARRGAIRARWREAASLTCKPFGYSDRQSGLAAWRAFFEICAESDFLTGKTQAQPGKPPFVADIDFLMSPSGFLRTLENKYHREAA